MPKNEGDENVSFVSLFKTASVAPVSNAVDLTRYLRPVVRLRVENARAR